GDGRSADIGFFSVRFEAENARIFGDVRAGEVAIAFLLKSDVLQSELKTGDFLRVDVPEQPGVRVTAIVSGAHDLTPFINVACVLRGASHPHKFRNSFFIEPFETADGGFGPDQARARFEEIG